MSGRTVVWRRLRRVLAVAFFIAVGVLLVRHARDVDWARVAGVLAGYTAGEMALVVALTAASYLLYTGLDLLARLFVGHHLSVARTLVIAAVCYAFNVNLGALVGGAAFRFRLYSRFGLPGATVARVYAFAVATNWSGYVLLLGLVLAPGLVVMPPQWELGMAASQVLGVALLGVVAGYLLLCARLPHRRWTVRGRELRLPALRTALAQLAVSTPNWMVMAAIIWLLLGRQVDYPSVLGTLLLAAVAGAMTHIPAGLGVIEAVFLLMLSARVAGHELIAALLAYRGAYYLLPLLLALPAYSALEIGAARRRAAGRDDAGGEAGAGDASR